MSRLFGYLLPTAASEEESVNVDYVTRQVPHVPEAKDSSPEHESTAYCRAHSAVRCSGLLIGLAGRAIWRGETLSRDSSAAILADLGESYRRSGPGLLADLEGPFALAILEPASRRALLAVDRMGIERITYALHGGGVVFGDSASAVAGFPSRDRSLRPQALYDFLFMHMVAAPETAFVDVRKLPMATVLQFENGRSEIKRYWQPTYRYARTSDFPVLQADLHASLSAATDASGLDEPTGAFLSGGLDSSSVAGVLTNATNSPANTFTVGFGESDYDELEFARTANKHFGCHPFEYQMTPADIVDAFPRIAAGYDEPFGNSSAAPTYFCAKLAADNGITHLLAGDGGDELFGGNERYVRQSVFELYYRVPARLRRGLLEPATRLISPESRITPLRKVRSYVDQAMIPLPERFESWNFMYREGGAHMLDAEFAASIDRDAPMRRMREVWESAPSNDLLERMLWYDWQFTLADNDLRKVGTMTEMAGVRVSYPFLHPAVVELSTRIPPSMKIKGTELRSFFKRAMADFLPREVIEKKKHGFGLPFGLWLKTDTALADLIYSHLTDLKKRHIIAADFIDNLIAQHRQGHESYFGYAIWDLAMLEAWMAYHVDRTKR